MVLEPIAASEVTKSRTLGCLRGRRLNIESIFFYGPTLGMAISKANDKPFPRDENRWPLSSDAVLPTTIAL